MTSVFADTSFFVALLQPADLFNQRALAALTSQKARIVTSEWVLVEVANFFARPEMRGYFAALVRELDEIGIEVVAADRHGFVTGFELFETRKDKYWSLTDCISCAFMIERGITDALTTDHHFEQAGFNVLLK